MRNEGMEGMDRKIRRPFWGRKARKKKNAIVPFEKPPSRSWFVVFLFFVFILCFFGFVRLTRALERTCPRM